jgi:hypothetical protein
MPGFTIDTRSEGSDENGKPYVELYYSEETVVSKIQETVIASLEEYDTEVYDVSEDAAMLQSRELRAVPTTIAMDKDYEIERWEGPTHADDIREVLNAW